MAKMDVSLFDYIKVEVRDRSPKRWGWTILRTATDVVVERSTTLFQDAEDALKAGQKCLAAKLAEPPDEAVEVKRRHALRQSTFPGIR